MILGIRSRATVFLIQLVLTALGAGQMSAKQYGRAQRVLCENYCKRFVECKPHRLCYLEDIFFPELSIDLQAHDSDIATKQGGEIWEGKFSELTSTYKF